MRPIPILLCLLTFAAALRAEEYQTTLARLMAGPYTMPAAQRTRFETVGILGRDQALPGGLAFGMTMQEVVDRWGTPRSIWVRGGSSDVELTIFSSTFRFNGGKLFAVSLHSVDLPNLQMLGGKVRFDQPLPDLQPLFPGAIITEDKPLENMLTILVVLADGMEVEFSNLEGKCIAIGLMRPAK